MHRLILGAFALGILFNHSADATTTNPDGKYADWFSAQHAKSDITGEEQVGGRCCDLGDGYRWDGNYTPNLNGSVTLNTVDGPIPIPAYKVLDGTYAKVGDETRGGPNPTGHAILWTQGGYPPETDGSNIYCFSPGTLG